eukprot:scaffold100655_cov19-Tisochrysis_lutea.AAC.2
MEKVLTACAKASKLDHKRVLLCQQLDLLPADCHDRIKQRIADIEDQIIMTLKVIDDDMNRWDDTRGCVL